MASFLIAVLLQPPQIFFAVGWTIAALACSLTGWKAFWRLFTAGAIMLALGIFAVSFVPVSDPNGLDYGFVWLSCAFYLALTFPISGLFTHLMTRKRETSEASE